MKFIKNFFGIKECQTCSIWFNVAHVEKQQPKLNYKKYKLCLACWYIDVLPLLIESGEVKAKFIPGYTTYV